MPKDAAVASSASRSPNWMIERVAVILLGDADDPAAVKTLDVLGHQQVHAQVFGREMVEVHQDRRGLGRRALAGPWLRQKLWLVAR